MQTCVSQSRLSFLGSLRAGRPFHLLGSIRLGHICVLLLAFMAASGIAYGQSTSGQATINIAIDDNNCTFSDPNSGTIENSGQIFITINNTETESAIYQCITSGAPYDYIQNLVNAINQNSQLVNAAVISDGYFSTGGSIALTARTTGGSTNYPLSVSATWDTAAGLPFTGPAYVPSAPTSLTGGEDDGQVVYPRYQIQSIIYATPGNRSNNGFTNSTTNGTITSVGKTYGVGNTTTFSIGGGFLGVGSTLSWSYGHGKTTGDTTSTTATITQASGVANATNAGAPDAIDHHQDLFIIWLNPAVEVIQTGTNTATFAMGTQSQVAGDPSPGTPQIQDQVEVFASTMMPNAQGQTTVPLEVLIPRVIDGQHLPGLGNICANKTIYPNSCTQANQCGCVPSDFAPILAQDLLLNFAPTDNPLNADTSGPAGCNTPTPSSSCRYVPVMVAPNSNVQVTETLSGPQSVGGNIPVNTFLQTDSTQTSQTFTESTSNSVGFTVDHNFGVHGLTPAFDLRNQTLWTWTNSETTGTINGTANSMNVSLSSSTVDCVQSIAIFEDTMFHTFVFQQPAGNNSCTVPAAPNFSLASTPTSRTVAAGNSATYTLSTTALNGFTGTVALAASGLPTGATATFSPASVTGTGSSTLTVATTTATTPGSYTFTVTGTSGSLAQSAILTLVVNPPDGVTITSPTNNSTINGTVRVTASASESSATIAQMQVWDNTTGVRLGINNGSTIDQTYTLATGTHQIIVEDLASGTFAVLHTATVNITVTADGVTITSPTSNSNQSTSVRVTASASESSSQIAQMQVWDNTTGVRLGINNGSTIDQTYTLAPGTHQIIVEDLASGTFAVLHTASVTITVFADGVTITAPTNNATVASPVRVTAFATESGSQIAQMQVWDNTTGVRLGINNGSTIDQTYTLAAGTHQIIVEDLAAGTFAVLHTKSVTITVQ
jgi:Big-like domain-containing protein